MLSLIKKLYNLIFVQLSSRWYCILSGIRYKKGYKINGRLRVSLGSNFLIRRFVVGGKGSLHIGERFSCNNKFTSNSLGLIQPCFFNVRGQLNIADNVGISGSTICVMTKVSIGNNVLIGSGCLINDSDSHPIDYSERRNNDYSNVVSKPITIEDDVFIGTRCIILKGVTIGQGAIVGAGSVVTKDVEPFTIVAGNPIRVIKKVEYEDSGNIDLL